VYGDDERVRVAPEADPLRPVKASRSKRLGHAPALTVVEADVGAARDAAAKPANPFPKFILGHRSSSAAIPASVMIFI